MGFSNVREMMMDLLRNAPGAQGGGKFAGAKRRALDEAMMEQPPEMIAQPTARTPGWTGGLARHLGDGNGTFTGGVQHAFRRAGAPVRGVDQRSQFLQMLGRLGGNLSQGADAQQPLPPALMKRIGRWMR